MRRFLIMGLPRSGTTYLMTLLNAHPRVHCSGEQFNPHAIVGIGGDRDDSLEAVLARDRDPAGFFERFFERHRAPGRELVGFKFMIGHNVGLLDHIAGATDIRLIYVRRDNRLAQISSLIRAVETKEWARTRPEAGPPPKLRATPRQISQRWHEYATFDRLFKPWFDALPHQKTEIEYREMFAPGFDGWICHFLGLPFDPAMKSPLVKQNANTILDRFAHPEPIRRYFTAVGRAGWLQDELPAPGTTPGPAPEPPRE
jgi:LPS sulfotransferase NodH